MSEPRLPKAYSRYGSSMGRRDTRADCDESIKFRVYEVSIADGYDNGGAYWGSGEPLFRAVGESETADGGECEMWFRARDRNRALDTVLREYPKARFFKGRTSEPKLTAITSSGAIVLILTRADALDAARGDGAIESVLCSPYVASQTAAWSPEVVRGELAEVGCWEAAELADHAAENVKRLVWVLACDLADEICCGAR